MKVEYRHTGVTMRFIALRQPRRLTGLARTGDYPVDGLSCDRTASACESTAAHHRICAVAAVALWDNSAVRFCGVQYAGACVSPPPRAQRTLMRATTPVGRKTGVVRDARATSDVRLRAKADTQRICNRVRGIGRSGHGDVNQ